MIPDFTACLPCTGLETNHENEMTSSCHSNNRIFLLPLSSPQNMLSGIRFRVFDLFT